MIVVYARQSPEPILGTAKTMAEAHEIVTDFVGDEMTLDEAIEEWEITFTGTEEK